MKFHIRLFKYRSWVFTKKLEKWEYRGRVLYKYNRNGNSYDYKPFRLLRLGFSGSIAKPYEGIHLYIWKWNIYMYNNPFRKLMYWYLDTKQDFLYWRQFRGDPQARCPHCGSYRFREGHGFAYEPIVWCKKCHTIVWEPEDITPYII